MSFGLIDSLIATPPVADCFSDRAVLEAMLAFEIALADAEADLGLIPAQAARHIRGAAVVDAFDAGALARDARASATPAIPFVNALVTAVRHVDADAASYVHWGATSQDLVDSALAICVQRAMTIIAADQAGLQATLVSLSNAHASTVMLGRTLLQPATPITFGLKVALWTGSQARAWQAVVRAVEGARTLQLGGAAGTLAMLGDRGPDVRQAVATRLGLACPAAPFHAARDGTASLVTALAVYGGTLGKMATDIALLMQSEVGEVAERGGGSSTMPHKRNPSGCAVILAAAHRAAGLGSTALAVLPQSHERAVGGWQGEAPLIRDVVAAIASAVLAARDVLSTLEVFPAQMLANLARTDGSIFAEKLASLLTPKVGRNRAGALVAEALADVRRGTGDLGHVVRSTPALATHLSEDELATLTDPARYLGSAEHFRRQLLEDVEPSPAR